MKQHVYRKTSSAPPRQTTKVPAKPPAPAPKRRRKKGPKVLLTVLAILVALYLFTTALCALKFNSLNPIRTGVGIISVVTGAKPYQQVADIPYKAFVATAENSEQYLIAMLEAEGYEYEAIQSLGGARIFAKDDNRLRVVVSGNAYFTRWVFSKESPLPPSSMLEGQP
ncbi:hypothetical protein LJC61_08835 [Ruminococcaceae bacterium OttesenSCG-928-A16]|nr:hypothetical protein [Ruminococcaceae bacterium OttesenSCG-928-A16]